ncbi:polysaccharide deacetylase [Parapusillimonas granuli]|uniref:Polysaccharide deacetylase n=1 Tax=Parapusillimonas granuli TaxID=380911 RepID=A0A853FZP3_9BURK|nr:polysaccharide deacetylase [Parapusillimonas granuli]
MTHPATRHAPSPSIVADRPFAQRHKPLSTSIVCLSFDFDAISLWIARGATSPTPISRGEFGVVGTRRILRLLERYDVKATWFIPGHTLETYPDLCREIRDAGHEIGHHGWSHVSPVNMSLEEERASLIRANETIRNLTGAYAAGYRSPAWDLSANSVDLLIEQGFKYDSSMMADDYTPYFVRHRDVIEADQPARFGPATSLVEMPVSWSLDDFPHFEFTRTPAGILPGLMNANGVLENWMEDFLYMKENLDWGAVTYTFHPQVIGRGHRMRMLERLIIRLLEEGAQFERMADVVAEHTRRLDQLNSQTA